MSDCSPRPIAAFLTALLAVLVVTGSTAFAGPVVGATSGLSVDSPTEPVRPDDAVTISATASTPGNDTTFAIDGDADGTISPSEVIATVKSDGTGAASTTFRPSDYGIGSVADGDFSVYSYEEDSSGDGTSGPNDDGSSTSPGAAYDKRLSLTVDGSPPTVTADSLPSVAGGTVDVTGWFTVANSDGGTTSYNYSTDSGVSWTPIGSETAFDTTTLDDGSVLFGANDTDDAGNADTDWGAVEIDNSGPTVTADGLPSAAGGTVDVTGWFSITNSDGGSTDYNYSTDGGTSWTPIGSETAFDTTALTDGSVLFGVNDSDDAGNYDTASGTVTVDNTAPSVSITSPADGEQVTAQTTIEGSSSDTTAVRSVNVTIQRDSDDSYWNGAAWQSTETNVSATADDETFDGTSEDWRYDSSAIAADTYSVFANVTDTAGNTNRSTTIDYTLYTASSSSTSSSSGDSSSATEETVDISDVTVARQESRTPTVDEAEGTSTVTFSDGANVESISFESTSVSGTVTTRTLSETPAATGSVPGTTVSVVSITVPDSAAATSATVRTRVSAARLDATVADPTELRVNRYDEAAGEWQPLPTELVTQSGSGAVLEAETPGFSIFAVSIEPSDEEEADDATADSGATEQTRQTATNTVGANGSAATTTDDTAGTTEGFAPGFGVVAALVTLLSVAAFARRRQ